MKFLSLQKHYRIIVALLGIFAVLFWGMAFYQSLQQEQLPVQADISPTVVDTIILDPGHGGIDPGACSESGLQEKVVNLQIARCLKSMFTASGYQVIMTRETDTDLSSDGKSAAARKTEDLKARLALFEQTQHALVLSIHQNHYPAASSHGAQMFYGSHPLAQEIAASIQSQITANVQVDNTRVIKPVGKEVYIIYHTTRPAVLCECGFLSNPDDAAKLVDADYCKKIAFCIYTGVLQALQKE